LIRLVPEQQGVLKEENEKKIEDTATTGGGKGYGKGRRFLRRLERGKALVTKGKGERKKYLNGGND